MNIALILTFSRLILSPLLLAPLIAFKAPALLVSSIYFLLAATDFLDGFFARRYKQATVLGAFLDQFADKVFLFSVVIATVATQQCAWWQALLLILRELLVMGFREYGMQRNIAVPVIFSAKVKTTFQMLFFGAILLGMPDVIIDLLFGITLFLSYYSAYYYGRRLVG